ncbi:MAG: flippase-like domain-containing protein [Verrucomicrobia bacterium]|nr:flippase-like domain-containing protein [Verrucomicrobiota bacterium]MCH8511420.1 flippase-like domain-containing protein [Kiritimatiellia bacterium]
MIKRIYSARKNHKKILSYCLSSIFIVIIVCYIFVNIQEFSKLEITNFYFIGLLFLLVVIRIFATGQIMDLSVRSLGIRLSLIESFGLANLTRLMNQVLPGKVGVIMRSVYLNKKHGLSYAGFISSFSASQLVLFLISSFIGLLSILILKILGTVIPVVFFYILACLVIFLLLMLVLTDKLSKRIHNERLKKILTSWQVIRKGKCNIRLLIMWSIVFTFTSALILFSMFSAFGAEISLLVALFFSSINIVNSFIAITPAGFGTSEGILVALAYSVGIDIPTALAASLLLRVVTFFSVLTIAPFFSKKLFNKSLRDFIFDNLKKSTFDNKAENI